MNLPSSMQLRKKKRLLKALKNTESLTVSTT